MRNPDMVCVLKMEHVSKINIFGLKMMVGSGLEKIYSKFLYAQSLFQTYDLFCKRKDLGLKVQIPKQK